MFYFTFKFGGNCFYGYCCCFFLWLNRIWVVTFRAKVSLKVAIVS